MFLWSYAIGSPVAGWVADRSSRTRVIQFSLIAWSLVTMATGLTRSGNQLLALRFLLGLAECAYLPAAVGLLADHHGPRERGRAIGIHTAGLALGAIAGATLAGYLGQHYGWRSTFFLLGAVGIVLSFVAAPILREKEIKTARSTAGVAVQSTATGNAFLKLIRVPSYWVLLAQSMIVSVGIWLFLNWLPLYFTENFELSLAAAGFYGAALLEFPGLFGVVAGGYLSDTVARRNSAGRMLVQAICYLIAALLMLAFAAKLGFMFVAAALLGFSILRSFAVVNENPLLCDLLSPNIRSTAIGLMNTANTFAGGLGVFAAGLLKQRFGLSIIFAGVSIILLAAAALNAFGYLFVLRRDLRRRAEAVHAENRL